MSELENGEEKEIIPKDNEEKGETFNILPDEPAPSSFQEVSEFIDIMSDIKKNAVPIEDTFIEEKPKKRSKTENVETSEQQNLFEEFSSFLKKTKEITQDFEDRGTIPTGIDILDAILGGGFAIGAINVLVGQPGCGKSMLAAQCLANAQKLNPNMLSAYLDSEESMTRNRLINLGINSPPITPYNEITIEKVFKFIEGLCVFKETKKIIETPSMVIWDSIANTSTDKEKDPTIDVNQVIGYKARLLSFLLPKYITKLRKHNICLLSVNQLRDVMAMGQFAPPRDLKFLSSTKDMPSGNSLKFNSFQLLEIKVRGEVKEEDYGFRGFLAEIKCVKNKLFTPNIPVPICGNFVRGFSNFWTNFNYLHTTKRLTGAAGWWKLTDYPEIRFRRKDAEEQYETDLAFKETFDKCAKEAIKIDFIDKYGDA